jgi:hypothetical protein
MSESPIGTPVDYDISKMDEKYQQSLENAKDELEAEIELLQPLGGGFSGAKLFLAKISPRKGANLEQVVLKLDRYDKKTWNEKEQHDGALNSFSDHFRENHLVEMISPAVTLSTKHRIALFYGIAGRSLTDFRPLRAYKTQNILSKKLF